MKKASAVVEKHPQLIFFILLIGAYWGGFVWEAIPKHPQSLHISAQCDRASIALNFYQEEMNILVPRIHNRTRGTGIAAAEFPIIQYTVACIYKVVGFNDTYYRLVVMLLFSIGLYFAWKIALYVSKNHITALLVSLLWLSSPTLLYYVPNFNPDPVSLGFVMITWYYFLQWQTKPKVLFLFIIFFTACLAILVKASAAISIVAMIALVVLDFLRLLSSEKKSLISKKGLLLTALFLPAVVAYFWYSYASRLNASVYSEFFTLGMRLPQSIEQVFAIWKSLKANLLLHYYPPYFLVLIAPLHVVVLFLNKHIPRQLIWCTFILAAGTISFFFLMFVAMEYHDYYIITLLPWIFFLLLSLGTGLTNYFKHKQKLQLTAAAFGIALTIFNFTYCHKILSSLYSRESSFFQYAYEAFPEIKPLLEQHNVKSSDYVVTITDPSYDISLYLMNRHGYTVTNKKDINRVLLYLLTRDAKWLFTVDSRSLPDLPIIQSYFGKPVFVHKNISLYRPKFEDKKLTADILNTLHEHIAVFTNQLKADKNWYSFIQRYSVATGIPVDALIDDSALYIFESREQELQNMLTEFATSVHHSTEINTAIKDDFCKQKNLSPSDLYILQHPYSTWFNNL